MTLKTVLLLLSVVLLVPLRHSHALPPLLRPQFGPWVKIVPPKSPWNFNCLILNETESLVWTPPESAAEYFQSRTIDTMRPIRIRYVLAESTDRENEFLMNWAFRRANQFLSKRLKTDSIPLDAMMFGRQNASPPSSSGCDFPSKCNPNGVRVPAEFMQPCNWGQLESGVPQKPNEDRKLESVKDMSIVIYVRVYDPRFSERYCEDDGNRAFSAACVRHATNGRPLHGMIVFCKRPISFEHDHLLAILMHETVHVLTWSSFQGYKTTKYLAGPVDAQLYESRKNSLKNQTWREHIHRWKQNNGNTKYEFVELVTTPTVMQVVKDYFRCYNGSLLGAEVSQKWVGVDMWLPDDAHWSMRLFPGEMLSPMTTGPDVALSKLTLAALKDTGWYEVNMSMAMKLDFDASQVLDGGEYCHVATRGCDELLTDLHDRSLNGNQYVKRLDWIGAICDPRGDYTTLVNTQSCSQDGRTRYECYKPYPGTTIYTQGCSIYFTNASMDYRGVNCPNQLFKHDEATRRIGYPFRSMCLSFSIYQASYWDSPSAYSLNRADCLEFNCTPETKSIDFWMFPSNGKPCKVSQLCGVDKPAIVEWSTSMCRPPYWGRVACPIYENICEKPGAIGIPIPADPAAKHAKTTNGVPLRQFRNDASLLINALVAICAHA